MTFDAYQAIQEHAPNSSATAAGDLHEEIWTDLLRRCDPRVHNVRVTRGDGGLDGVAFQDPSTGEARVYQAKFFKDLNDDKGTHRALVVDSFVRAHNHPFGCTSWVLLLPRVLSHGDLGWLMGAMKAEAQTLAASKKNVHADINQRIAACAIEYRDGADLVDLLSLHLDIAARHLPNSHLALAKQLQDERAARARDRDEIGRLLRTLNDESIRAHQADARRAKAALSILNQGWANLTGMLQRAVVDQNLAGATMKEIADQVEHHATNRAGHAYSCEGLAPGVSELIAEINYQARVLQQVTIMKEIGMADAEGESDVAKRIIERINELQRRIGEVVALLL